MNPASPPLEFSENIAENDEDEEADDKLIEYQYALGNVPYDNGCSFTGILKAICVLCCFPVIPSSCIAGRLPQELEDFMNFQRNYEDHTHQDFSVFEAIQAARLKAGAPRTVFLEDIEKSLDTGDVVFFVTVDEIGSALVKVYTGQWTHVAMVVKLTEQRPNGKTSQKLLLWESVSSADGCLDYYTRRPKAGIRLVGLRARLKSSPSLYYGVLRLGHTNVKLSKIRREFERYRALTSEYGYDHNKLHLLRAAFNFDISPLGHNTPTIKSNKFCSQLVAETWEETGIFEKEADSNNAEVTPADIWSRRLNLAKDSWVDSMYLVPRLEFVEELEREGPVYRPKSPGMPSGSKHKHN